jgi:DNA-binding NarL/FixJ family response regulator
MTRVLRGGGDQEDGLQLLSKREYEVLRMLASGLAIQDIAVKLSLSPKTISTYRARILEKLGLHSNADLVRYVIEQDHKHKRDNNSPIDEAIRH